MLNPIRVAVYREDPLVMEEPVEHGGCNDLVAERCRKMGILRGHLLSLDEEEPRDAGERSANSLAE